MIVRDWTDRGVLSAAEWMGRAVVHALLDARAAADLPPAVDPDAPVVVVGGFGATAPVMHPLADVLARRGHPVTVVAEGGGAGCAGSAAGQLAHRVEILAQDHGRPVHLVGHSRGVGRCASRM